MLLKGDRVRHINPEIDKLKGVMNILEIKNGQAICGYLDYSRLHLMPGTFPISELKKA